MLKKFLPLRRSSAAADPAIPAGERVYAIGDVHGRLDLLDALITQIDVDDAARAPAQTTLIFLGDLVDRGPDSAGVVERVRTLSAEGRRVRCLMGNHEEVFLSALGGKREAVRAFCRIGGRETVLSYGVSPRDYEAMDYGEVAARLETAVPAPHRALLADMEDMIVIGDYVFVHAGIRPDVPLADQRRADLRWIREPFLSHRGQHEKMVVHGHTIMDSVERRPGRIGIDTGAYASGRLTAIGLENRNQWLLDTGAAVLSSAA